MLPARGGRNSLLVVAGAASVATVLGMPSASPSSVSGSAVACRCWGSPCSRLIVRPIVWPCRSNVLFGFLDVDRSLVTIAAGHSVVALPFATLISCPDRRIDPRGGRGHGLGASYPQALRRVTIPLIGPSLLSAWLTASSSRSEVAIALFLAVATRPPGLL